MQQDNLTPSLQPDFVTLQCESVTHDGRALHILVVTGEYTRECLAFRVARRLGSCR
jgi:hypothetical protein